MRLHYLQHVPQEGLGTIAEWAQCHGGIVTATRFYDDEPLPSLDAFDWLVILGGPMSVHDVDLHPWLDSEKNLIRRAIDARRKVLGICLGGQLMAEALGGTVSRNPQREIGWFPLERSDDSRGLPLLVDVPPEFMAFHWHGETFTIPPGATHAASSEACTNQMFVYGDNALALQFHLEYTRDGIELMMDQFENEMTPGPYVQEKEAIRAGYRYLDGAKNLLFQILDRLNELPPIR